MIEIRIRGLHCVDCSDKIERSLSSIEGVEYVKIYFTTGKMKIKFDSNKISLVEIHSYIKDLGYGILEEEIEEEEGVFSLRNREFVFTIISGVALFIGLFVAFLTPDPHILRFYHPIRQSELFLGAAMIFGGYHVARRSAKGLMNRRFVMDTLIIIGATGAILIDAFGESAAILFLFSLAELLEDFSVERSRRSLNELMELAPKVASVRRGDRFVEVPIDEIDVGDIVLVRPGERIAVDGRVIRGTSSVDQASITGESIPVTKHPGSITFAGTINQEGSLEIEVTKEASDSTLARIVEMVESAEEQKAPMERFIDRFAKYYTPVIVMTAITVFVVATVVFHQPTEVWFYKALLLLLIACPCALALSTPIAMVSAITSGAKNGVLFKGGAYVERLAKIDIFAFDKTGTLTEGRPRVTDVIPFNGYTREDVLSIAASLERLSEHPLGKAIVELADEEGVPTKECVDLTMLTGKGIRGRIGSEIYLVGSRNLFAPDEMARSKTVLETLEDEAKTIVIVGREREIAGVIGITDKIREGCRTMIETLHGMGIKRTIMITGDNERTARAVAERIGIDEYHAELLPEQKVSIIREIGGGRGNIAMVGDGVNDAPAMATADLGIAMGAAGSDTALEVADIALLNDDITRVRYLILLGKRTMRVVKQNIALSIGVKLTFAILIFPGYVTLWMAVAIGDMGVSLGVILNALRLSRLR